MDESHRISKLASGTPVVPGKRLPIIKIPTSEYTKPKIIKNLTTNHTHLILCHGHTHPKPSYFPPKYLLLDINPVARPDILGDIKHTRFMSNFPTNHFSSIILTYIPPPHPFAPRNLIIYKNLYPLLKEGGQIQSFYMSSMLLKRRLFKSKLEMIQNINQEALKLGFKASIDRNLVILTKLSKPNI